MVTDILFWIVLAFVMAMLFVWWRMYEVLKDKVHNNYQSLCEKTLDVFGEFLNKISDDIVEIKDIQGLNYEKFSAKCVDDIVNTFTQRDIKLFQSIDMLRKNVNDLRASFEVNCGKSIKVDDVQMKDVDEELYGNKGKIKTFAEMSFEDINIYNELNQKNDGKEDSENDFSVEEL